MIFDVPTYYTILRRHAVATIPLNVTLYVKGIYFQHSKYVSRTFIPFIRISTHCVEWSAYRRIVHENRIGVEGVRIFARVLTRECGASAFRSTIRGVCL